MAGNFEVFLDADSLLRFRLLGPDGAVVAVSGAFEDKRAVAAGIAAVRECAGTGLVTDLSSAGPVVRSAIVAVPDALPASAVVDQGSPDCADLPVPDRMHAFTAKGSGRQPGTPRWIRAVAR